MLDFKKEHGLMLISIVYFIYFSTKIFWDLYTPIFELISVGTLAIFALIQFVKSLSSTDKKIKSLVLAWTILIIYIVVNGLFINFDIKCFVRSLYEYGFYLCIIWSGAILSKHLNMSKIITIMSWLGLILAILSFIEFIFKFHIISMNNYGTYVQFDGQTIVRSRVFTRSYLSHGVLLGIFSLCNLHTFFSQRKTYYLIMCVVCFCAILATGSRGPLVATFGAIFVYLLLYNFSKIKYFLTTKKSILNLSKKTYIFIAVLAILVFAIILNLKTGISFIDYSILRIRSIFNWTGDPGNVGRLKLWSNAFDLFKSSPFFGVGVSKTGSWGSSLYGVTESDFLKRFAELGMVGGLVYYAFITSILVITIKDKLYKNKEVIFSLSIISLILFDSAILQITEEIMIAFYFYFFLGFLISKFDTRTKTTILYFSNVDWYWIKQRPHFIAEGLAEKYDLKFVYQYRYSRKNMQKKRTDSILKTVYPIYVIPKGDRYSTLKEINQIIKRVYISIMILLFDINKIIITYPNQISSIPKFYKGTVLYDCMDNHIEFINDKRSRDSLKSQENEAVNRSDIIVASSEHLKQTLISRYPILKQKKIEVVRNAYNGNIYEVDDVNSKSETYKICYFGTISSWFNFDIILNSLKMFDNIEFYLYGPYDSESIIPKNAERLNIMGTVEHSKLHEVVKEMDCLIMPFVVNDLIKSVDPVKLYEYINFNKNIITVYYDEIKRFNDFVHFYNNQDEFNQIIFNLLNNNEIKYNNIQRTEFLQHNSWKSRIEQINELINQ